MKKSIMLSPILLFIILVFISPLTAYALSNGPNTPLRPEWLGEGDYVTYLVTVTKGWVTQTSYIKETVIDDSGATIYPMRIESFEAQISPNFQLSMGNLQSVTEDAFDINFMTIEEKVATYKPEIELVRGLNNKTYEAYRLTCDQILDVVGPGGDCNLIVWFEKETLIKVRQIQWHKENGMNETYQQLIEDSNIQGLAASPSSSTTNTTSTPAKTVTTTIFVKSPQIIVTTSTTVTVTTTITGSQTVETTTVTETRNTSDSTAAIPISAGIVLAGAVISIALLKRKVGSS